jgi:membrane protein
MREAIRTVWHQNVKAGNFFKKKAVDVVILAGLGITLIFSLLVSAAAGAFTDVALDLVGLEGGGIAGLLVTVLGTVLALFTSTLLFLYLFIRLPKVQTPWREIVKGALLAAVLFEVLKRVGAVYIERTTENPLYGAFAVVVGLLVWINLVSRMLLFCAAWTVTAPYDSDVKPSGTADPEQARKAGIPQEFADDDDPDHVPAVQADGAPSPLLAALQGATPAAGRARGPAVTTGARGRGRPARHRRRAPGDRRLGRRQRRPGAALRVVVRRAGAARAAPAAEALPGEAATRRAAQVGAAAITAGAVGVGLYALKTVVGVFRR